MPEASRDAQYYSGSIREGAALRLGTQAAPPTFSRQDREPNDGASPVGTPSLVTLVSELRLHQVAQSPRPQVRSRPVRSARAVDPAGVRRSERWHRHGDTANSLSWRGRADPVLLRS